MKQDNEQHYTVAVVGNPNSGKTTLFNGLTGGKQKIGNWPGVTVEKKEGLLRSKNKNINVVDLPGIYSLAAHSEDEKVARDYILSGEPDLVINIVDATNIERNLFLTTQLFEMNVPMLIIFNRIDLAKKEEIQIDFDLIEKEIGCRVLSASSIKKEDIESVKFEICKLLNKKNISRVKIEYPDELESAIKSWRHELSEVASEIGADERWVALRLLEEDSWITAKVIQKSNLTSEIITEQLRTIESVHNESTDIIIADYRYGFIHGLTKESVKKKADKQKITDKIDRFVLNRVLGVPIFLTIMYLVFWLTMNIGGAFIDFFDILSRTIFVDSFGVFLNNIGSPGWLTTIIAGGIGAGIQTVATFIPIIFMMFFMLSILEDSGYMARAAFVMDKFMRFIGLPGKSFVSMLVGFGCTVPAVMSTRTLENKKDRMLTVFMTPFMSCGARLPVYVLFTAAFFPGNSGNMVFSLYIVGILLAILTGVLLKKTIFKGEASHFVMELPAYNLPRFRHIMLHTWNRLKEFIFRAGKVIVIIVMLLSSLNSMGSDGSFGNEDSEKSVLASIGKTITPIFKPMGIDEKNWPASVAVFTGIFAKEAVVGTLSALYSQIDKAENSSGDNTAGEQDDKFDFFAGVSEAFATIPANLSSALFSFSDPLGVAIVSETDTGTISEEIGTDSSIFGLLKSYFSKGAAQAYAFLLFILVYFPCVAAFSAVLKEIGIKMGIVLVTYLTLIGWILATLVYQMAVGHQLFWIILPLCMLGAIILTFYLMGKSERFKLMGKP